MGQWAVRVWSVRCEENKVVLVRFSTWNGHMYTMYQFMLENTLIGQYTVREITVIGQCAVGKAI